MGPVGPAGPAGAAGAPGTLPKGTLIFLLSGDPVPAGYTYVGRYELRLDREDQPWNRRGRDDRDVVIRIYKKN
jgi:hypothetical protein